MEPFNPATALLPAGLSIEVVVRLLDDETGDTLQEAIIDLDKGDLSRPSFRDIGLAVQAGSYEGLRAVWPHPKEAA